MLAGWPWLLIIVMANPVAPVILLRDPEIEQKLRDERPGEPFDSTVYQRRVELLHYLNRAMEDSHQLARTNLSNEDLHRQLGDANRRIEELRNSLVDTQMERERLRGQLQGAQERQPSSAPQGLQEALSQFTRYQEETQTLRLKCEELSIENARLAQQVADLSQGKELYEEDRKKWEDQRERLEALLGTKMESMKADIEKCLKDQLREVAIVAAQKVTDVIPLLSENLFDMEAQEQIDQLTQESISGELGNPQLTRLAVRVFSRFAKAMGPYAKLASFGKVLLKAIRRPRPTDLQLMNDLLLLSQEAGRCRSDKANSLLANLARIADDDHPRFIEMTNSYRDLMRICTIEQLCEFNAHVLEGHKEEAEEWVQELQLLSPDETTTRMLAVFSANQFNPTAMRLCQLMNGLIGRHVQPQLMLGILDKSAELLQDATVIQELGAVLTTFINFVTRFRDNIEATLLSIQYLYAGVKAKRQFELMQKVLTWLLTDMQQIAIQVLRTVQHLPVAQNTDLGFAALEWLTRMEGTNQYHFLSYLLGNIFVQPNLEALIHTSINLLYLLVQTPIPTFEAQFHTLIEDLGLTFGQVCGFGVSILATVLGMPLAEREEIYSDVVVLIRGLPNQRVKCIEMFSVAKADYKLEVIKLYRFLKMQDFASQLGLVLLAQSGNQDVQIWIQRLISTIQTRPDLVVSLSAFSLELELSQELMRLSFDEPVAEEVGNLVQTLLREIKAGCDKALICRVLGNYSQFASNRTLQHSIELLKFLQTGVSPKFIDGTVAFTALLCKLPESPVSYSSVPLDHPDFIKLLAVLDQLSDTPSMLSLVVEEVKTLAKESVEDYYQLSQQFAQGQPTPAQISTTLNLIRLLSIVKNPKLSVSAFNVLQADKDLQDLDDLVRDLSTLVEREGMVGLVSQMLSLEPVKDMASFSALIVELGEVNPVHLVCFAQELVLKHIEILPQVLSCRTDGRMEALRDFLKGPQITMELLSGIFAQLPQATANSVRFFNLANKQWNQPIPL